MADIQVTTLEPGEEEWTFNVVVHDTSRTEHRVTMKRLDYERLTGETTKVGEMAGPEAFVRRSFEFLLEREPQGSILREFDISVISRYFPEYEEEILRKYPGR